MLKQQNNFWQLSWPDLQLPLFHHDGQQLSVQHWLQQLVAVQHYVANCPGQNVLLYQRDSVQFSLWFIALCQAGKHIVLAPDDQPQTMTLVAQYCDWQVPTTPLPLQHTPPGQTELQLDSRSQISFFTSGSTGQPKLISKRLSQLLLEVQTLQQQFGTALPADTLFAAAVSYQHIYGLLFRMLWPLCYGHQQHTEQLRYLEQWQALLCQQPVVLVASPALLARFDDIGKLTPQAAHCVRIFSSGGPLAETVPPLYRAALGQPPTEVFGSTETGGIAHRHRYTPDASWQVFAGVTIQQSAQQALQVSSAYLDTAGSFTTSDQIELLADGSFRLLGRLDRIVKIAEKRLSLPELEQHCRTHPWVEQAAALVLQHSKPQLALVVALNRDGLQQLEQQGKLAVNQQLKQHLLQRFERVMLPRKFRYVAALPYNQQGKLPLAQLEALFNHD